MIDSGELDEMNLFQSPSAPGLKVGDEVQMLFFHKDNYSGKQKVCWSTGTIYRGFGASFSGVYA